MLDNEAKSNSESVEDILRSSLAELAQHHKEAYDLLLQKASEGFFEQHQTSGSLRLLADEILAMSMEGEGSESKKY